jgi:hypothetical protein
VGETMMNTTIAVMPRDRFSEAVRTVRSILETKPVGFRLIAVDGTNPRTVNPVWPRARSLSRGSYFLSGATKLLADACGMPRGWVGSFPVATAACVESQT